MPTASDSATPTLIDSFYGPYDWASNFYMRPLVIDDVEYPSGEHGFNALKTLDPAEREHVRTARTPAEAKQRGRRVTLRAGWDETVRYDAMRVVTAAKYADPDLRTRLLATGDALLIEGTGTVNKTHHDQHWGDCGCAQHKAWPGQNHLGRTIMAERARLAGRPANWWPRVAVTGHRPQHLTPDQQAWAQEQLDRLAVKVRDEHGTQVAITGCALGADTWWARSAHRAGLPLWAYVPFEVQPSKWRPADQETWRKMLASSARVLMLAKEYDVRLLHARNEYMIRDADLVIAVYDRSKTTGGTAGAVAKAQVAGKALVFVDVVTRQTTISRPAVPAVAP